jgi:hypothetical protein
MPTNGVMVLRHDFHSKAAFEKSLSKGGEVHIDAAGIASSTVPSWTNLFRMLCEFGIPARRCFFTNVYMGLRTAEKTTGRFPGSKDVPFVDRCRVFFYRQLEAQEPRLILALGVWVPRFLAPLSGELADWELINSFQGIDEAKPVRHAVRFKTDAVPPCSVVCLTHPSLRGPNVRRRSYGSRVGVTAEQAMVADGIRLSGVDLRVV